MANRNDIDYNTPVAYDKDGSPLYAHPPAQNVPAPPSVTSDRKGDINGLSSEEIQLRHKKSISAYPELNLSAHEYVMSNVTRHWVGVASTVSVGVLVTILVVVAWGMVPSLAAQSDIFWQLSIPAVLVLIIVWIATYLAYWVYKSNKFYLTNESVISEIQNGLFNRREQTIGLESIEDVGFEKAGVIEYLFNYGTVRLSTIGDETMYLFKYVADPKSQAATITNAVERFKDSRGTRH